MVYPWQVDAWQQYLDYLVNERLTHAILVSGPPAIGKLEFCRTYVQRMNCTNPDPQGYPCGACDNCHLIKAGTHPDVRFINMEEADRSEQIRVDDIREINRFMALSRQQGRFKVVCINRAHRMNINAANALLKTLEEPPPGSVLFLVSDRAEGLPATIRSRCQIWKFGVPDSTLALHWLQEKAASSAWQDLLGACGGRPLLAWESHDSGLGKIRTAFYEQMHALMAGKETVTGISSRLRNEDPERIVEWLQAWCGDLIRCRFKEHPETIENPDVLESLQNLAQQATPHSLFDCLDQLTDSKRIVSASMNQRLFVENMLVQCQQSLQPPSLQGR